MTDYSSHARPDHMSPEEFRHYGHKAVDWIADYWAGIESLPVLSQAYPGEVRAALPKHPPEHPEPFSALLEDLDHVILPGITHWQHPRFFGYFPANSSGPAVLGELLCAGLGVQGMLWLTSPACTELEQHVLDWLAELLGLPAHFQSTGTGGGVIQDSASSATLVALVAALHRVSGGLARKHGVRGRYTLYASTEAHSSVTKAAILAGLGEDAVRLLPIDRRSGGLEPGALTQAIQDDRAVGLEPALVVATVGTTSTTAIDPLRDIGEICSREGLWLHVDAAYAGVSAICPELRWINDGIEYADSYATNPHKWLLTNFDCGAFWVRDKAALVDALSIHPEYLRNSASESGTVIDYRDWQVPIGRRFRALKLWAVIRWYGAQGLRDYIRNQISLAAQFAVLVRQDERFEIPTPHPLALVTFRLYGNGDGVDLDVQNMALLNAVNDSGRLFMTHSKVGGRVTLRLCVGSPMTERRHVEEAWSVICEAATEVQRVRERY